MLARGAGAVAALAFAPALEAAPDPRLRVLAKTFRGQIVAPGSALYDRLRVPYDANYASVRPLAVVRPLDVADVQAVVRWSAAEHVPIVARSGGHSYAGTSTTRGVVVDLAHLAAVAVHGTQATVGAGARLGTIYATLDAHGVAIPAGSCPSVGIGGHVLGGGFGLASRAWGLACDNLVSLDVVTADGKLRHATAAHEPNLFWASRGGGGGNFGIATRFVFRTHRVASGSYFVGTWPWSQVEEVVGAYLQWAPAQPDALGSICRLAAGPGGPSVQVFGQFLGPPSGLTSALATLQPPAAKLVTGTATWLDLVRRWAGCLGHTLPGCSVVAPLAFAGASAYFARIPAAAQLGLFREVVEERGAASGALLIDAYGGAVNRIAPAATAFVHRRALASVQYFAAGGADARSWVEFSRMTLAPAATGEAYVNYLDPQLPNALPAYYGANLARLRRVKKEYDPHRLFHHAQGL